MTKSQNFRKRLLSTLWFIPAVLAVLGGLLGILVVVIDNFAWPGVDKPMLLDVQPSAARDMLAVVAGSMITVAGTVFSITIVALTLASTQFSPRILRNFMRDAGNQYVLGAFVGIFAYCVVVLRTIRENSPENGGNFVPSLAVALGVAFGLSGIGFLIYFIHHVATTIQATSIISQIAGETIAEIELTYEFEYEARRYDTSVVGEFTKGEWLKIRGLSTGYIQNIDIGHLFAIAERENVVVRVRRRVGEFAIAGLPLLEINAASGFKIDDKLVREFNAAYDVGNFRTIDGDVAFGLRQIVDIALKALSPAINDTTTALSCIDYLSAIMIALARRPSRPPLVFSGSQLRLIKGPQRFEDYFDLSFNQIRQNAAGNVAVILRLLNAMELLGKLNQNFKITSECRERHELILTQSRLLIELGRSTITADSDRESVEARYQRVIENL